MLKNNGKELFVTLLCSLTANIALMVLFYFLHVKQIMFAGLDVARYTSIAIVLTAVISGIVCYKRHKDKDDTIGAVLLASLLSFAAAFVGCISGAAIAAGIFGNLNG